MWQYWVNVSVLFQLSFLCPKTIHQQSHITIFLASTDINNKSQKGIKMACLPCPASYSTSFDQLFLRVLTPGWHAMCRIVERVPWFWIGSSILIFSIFWFLILICVLAHASHAMCQIIEHIPWVLTKLDKPLLHSLNRSLLWRSLLPPTCHSFEKVPFWESAILRREHWQMERLLQLL